MVAVSRGSSSSGLTEGDDKTSADVIVSPGFMLMDNDDTEPNISLRRSLFIFCRLKLGSVTRTVGGNVQNSLFLDL
jgi:hypothetical protein